MQAHVVEQHLSVEEIFREIGHQLEVQDRTNEVQKRVYSDVRRADASSSRRPGGEGSNAVGFARQSAPGGGYGDAPQESWNAPVPRNGKGKGGRGAPGGKGGFGGKSGGRGKGAPWNGKFIPLQSRINPKEGQPTPNQASSSNQDPSPSGGGK